MTQIKAQITQGYFFNTKNTKYVTEIHKDLRTLFVLLGENLCSLCV